MVRVLMRESIRSNVVLAVYPAGFTDPITIHSFCEHLSSANLYILRALPARSLVRATYALIRVFTDYFRPERVFHFNGGCYFPGPTH